MSLDLFTRLICDVLFYSFVILFVYLKVKKINYMVYGINLRLCKLLAVYMK